MRTNLQKKILYKSVLSVQFVLTVLEYLIATLYLEFKQRYVESPAARQ